MKNINTKKLFKALLITIGIITGVLLLIYIIAKLSCYHPIIALIFVVLIAIGIVTYAVYSIIS